MQSFPKKECIKLGTQVLLENFMQRRVLWVAFESSSFAKMSDELDVKEFKESVSKIKRDNASCTGSFFQWFV